MGPASSSSLGGWARWLVAPFAASIGLGAWAFWLEPASLRNEDHRLRLPGWPAQCDALRVAVLGNHDWWLDGPRIEAAFTSQGIRVLEDASVAIERGACRFWLAGISDFTERSHDIDAALSVVPQDAPVLAFTHNPDLFPDVPRRVNLTIAGHTHGGQVYFPGIGRPIVPSLYGERFAIGHVEESGRHLFVSAGLGTSILPVRFLVPPEVSVLILSPDSDSQPKPQAL